MTSQNSREWLPWVRVIKHKKMAMKMMIIIKQVFTNSTKTIAMHKNGALNKTKTNLAILREQQYKLITVINTIQWVFINVTV